ncbi:RraA family protein [Pseudomonas sp. S2_E02]
MSASLAEKVMIGFRIKASGEKILPQWVEAFRDLPVANISDCMARMTAGGADLRAFYKGPRMVGPALTVKTRPGDNLVVHKALDVAEPGDILVVDAGGDLTNALVGELMIAHATHRKLGGLVISGAIRDSAELLAGSFPVFALGVTHRGPFRDGPGEVNVPIALHGMVISPGDLVCGDADGVVSVARHEVEEVHALALKRNNDEVKLTAQINAGTSDRRWVDELLIRNGCSIE